MNQWAKQLEHYGVHRDVCMQVIDLLRKTEHEPACVLLVAAELQAAYCRDLVRANPEKHASICETMSNELRDSCNRVIADMYHYRNKRFPPGAAGS